MAYRKKCYKSATRCCWIRLSIFKKKENLKFVSKSDELNIKVTKWLEEIEYNKNSKELVAKNHKELMGHSKAPTVISDLIQDIIK